MDYYFEQSVCNNYPNRHKKKLIVLKIMKWAFIAIGILLLFLTFNTPMNEDSTLSQVLFWAISMLVFAILFFLSSFFLGRLVQNTNPEFDYSVNGGNLHIVRVVNKAKRKRFRTFRLDAFQEIGKAESESFERHSAQKEIKKIYAVANPEDIDCVYYALFSEGGEKSLLLFEPSQEFIITVTRTLNRNIFADKKGYRY